MLKRKNPFGDSSPLQLKTHVNETTVNELNGPNAPQMQKIYDRTRQLMLDGSRNMSQLLHNNNNVLCECDRQAATNTLSPGQLCLDDHGRLKSSKTHSEKSKVETHSHNVMRSAVDDMEVENKLALSECRNCRCQFGLTSGTVVMRPCSFCTQPVCLLCVRQCAACLDSFCTVCSTLNYSECFERCFCLQCASKY